MLPIGLYKECYLNAIEFLLNSLLNLESRYLKIGCRKLNTTKLLSVKPGWSIAFTVTLVLNLTTALDCNLHYLFETLVMDHSWGIPFKLLGDWLSKPPSPW